MKTKTKKKQVNNIFCTTTRYFHIFCDTIMHTMLTTYKYVLPTTYSKLGAQSFISRNTEVLAAVSAFKHVLFSHSVNAINTYCYINIRTNNNNNTMCVWHCVMCAFHFVLVHAAFQKLNGHFQLLNFNVHCR